MNTPMMMSSWNPGQGGGVEIRARMAELGRRGRGKAKKITPEDRLARAARLALARAKRWARRDNDLSWEEV